MPEQQGVDYGELMAEALKYWMGRSTSGGKPNFYPVPQTPEEKRWDDARYDLYKQGGTEGQQAVRSAAQQFMGGLPRTASPTFASPMMQGQAFAGGAMFPKIDISRFNMNAKPPGAASEPPGPGDAGRPTSDDRRESKTYGTDDPLNPRGGGGPFGPSPYGLDKIPPTGAPAQTPGETWNSFTTWWADYRQKNPNWKTDGAKAAINVAVGIFGGPLASKLFRALFLSGNPEAPGDEGAKTFESFWNGTSTGGGSAYGPNQRPPGMGGTTPAPGVGVSGGTRTGFEGFGAPGSVAPRQPPPGAPAGGTTRIDPATGRWVWTPSFADQAAAYWNGQFWAGLQTGPGGGPYGGGSGDAASGTEVMNRPTGGRNGGRF